MKSLLSKLSIALVSAFVIMSLTAPISRAASSPSPSPACTNPGSDHRSARASQVLAASKCPVALPTLATIGVAHITGYDSPASNTVRITGTGLSGLAYMELGSSNSVYATLVNPAGPVSWILPYQPAGYTISWTDTSIVMTSPNGFQYGRSLDSIYNVQDMSGAYIWSGGTWGSNFLNIVPTFSVML